MLFILFFQQTKPVKSTFFSPFFSISKTHKQRGNPLLLPSPFPLSLFTLPFPFSQCSQTERQHLLRKESILWHCTFLFEAIFYRILPSLTHWKNLINMVKSFFPQLVGLEKSNLFMKTQTQLRKGGKQASLCLFIKQSWQAQAHKKAVYKGLDIYTTQ